MVVPFEAKNYRLVFDTHYLIVYSYSEITEMLEIDPCITAYSIYQNLEDGVKKLSMKLIFSIKFQ